MSSFLFEDDVVTDNNSNSHFKPSPFDQQVKDDVGYVFTKSSACIENAAFSVFKTKGRVEIFFPSFDSRSEANCNENWRTRHARHKRQKAWVSIAMKSLSDKIPLPCKVTFIRLANRTIDSDNNVSAFKYCRDMSAAELTGDFRPGRADNDPRIEWAYGQEKAKKKGLKIIFEFDVL